ncbi:hypothetical protein [Tateyamaria sp. SN6-1]|uniref:hypothetical protein n=1 Tax=Tateyamaria sp. SN6-1 TaxID=3092148 RepID=UPI0039F5892F
MRFAAFVLTLLALVGAGFAGEQALRVWTDDAALAAPVQLGSTVEPSAGDTGTPPAPHHWPALFGELEPPAPEAPEPPAPAAEPKPPAPPIESLGYTLKGVVRAGDAVWGLVSHPTGEQIMRVGDVLSDGFTITHIDEQGLYVDTGHGTPVMLGFPEG